MSGTNTTAVVPLADRAVEYTAFGSQEIVKLSANIVRNFIATATRDGELPDERQCVKFVMLCKARALNPFEGDAFLTGYRERDGGNINWSLITSVQAFHKRAEASPEYDGLESGIIVKTADGALFDREGTFALDDDKVVGGWAKVYRKNQSHPVVKRVKFSTYDTGYSRWKKDGPGMIEKVARCQALREAFPTTLGGLYTQAEVESIPDTAARPDPSTAPEPPPKTAREKVEDEAAAIGIDIKGLSLSQARESIAKAKQPPAPPVEAPTETAEPPAEDPAPEPATAAPAADAADKPARNAAAQAKLDLETLEAQSPRGPVVRARKSLGFSTNVSEKPVSLMTAAEIAAYNAALLAELGKK